MGRSILWVAAAGAALFVTMTGCSSDRADRGERTAAKSSALSDAICNEGASGTAVRPSWGSTLVGPYDLRTNLDAQVASSLDERASVTARIRVTGPAGRVIERTMWSGIIDPQTTMPLSIIVADLPLHTVDEAAAAELVVSIAEPADYAGVEIASHPLFFRAESQAFDTFDLYGEAAPTTDHVFDTSSFEAVISDVQAATDDVRRQAAGEYWDDAGGSWRTLDALPPPNDDFHVLDRSLPLSLSDSSAIGALFQFVDPGPVDDGYAPVYVCADWAASFNDESRGEDRGPPYPASYAKAWLSEPSHLPLWSGALDAGGCTPPLRLNSYTNYTLGVRTQLHREVFGSEWNVNVLDDSAGIQTRSYGFTTLNVLRLPPSPDVYIRLAGSAGASTHFTRVAAVLSATLDALGSELPATTYTVRGNYGDCLACFQPDRDEVWIGANNDGTHNSQYKFVVAHEFGHAIQFHGAGTLGGTYPDSTGNDPGVCGCQFVVDPANRKHCLQSRQNLGRTLEEGFAHHIAARVWNDDVTDECTFVYYKEFNDGTRILRPPLPRSCGTWFVGWRTTAPSRRTASSGIG